MTTPEVFSPIAIIEAHGGGSVMEQWQEKLTEVCRAIAQNGGKGAVTLAIKIATDRDDEMKTVFDIVITSKSPARKHPKHVYYLNERGQVMADDPRQMKIAGVA